MYHSFLLPNALTDLEASVVWYDSKQRGLGKKLIKEFRKKLKLIEHRPHIYAIRYDDVRTTLLDIFPFIKVVSEVPF